jgi:hypothetical protein
MSKLLALATLSMLALSIPARAQLVVGNDQSGTATIYDIDPSTGFAAPIYTSAANDAKPWGLAYDASTNTLYWNNGSVLYASPYGPALTPVSLGTLTFNGAPVNFVGLGFHNGKLYGTRNVSIQAVYEIDPATLVATQSFVYDPLFDFGGLDYDDASGILYGLSDSAPAPAVRGLYRIDLVAQTTTFVAPYPPGRTDIDGLAVHNGLAYYVTDGPSTAQPSFYVFDVATGTQLGTIPSPFTGSGTFAAATWASNTPPPSSTPYCFGDGSGSACPCGNFGTAGNGCANSVNAAGGKLSTSGNPNLANDTLVLHGSGMPAASALYFQGTTRINGGFGAVFGDGLRCAGGTTIRLTTVANDATGASQIPQPGDPSVSQRGLVTTPGTRTYQVWYRNAAAFCTPSTFNLTNGIEVSWS